MEKTENRIESDYQEVLLDSLEGNTGLQVIKDGKKMVLEEELPLE